jgi:hypothetical protein
MMSDAEKQKPETGAFSREGLYTGETVKLTPEQEKARKRRSQWTALALFAFVILIFAITIAKLGPENLQAAS